MLLGDAAVICTSPQSAQLGTVSSAVHGSAELFACCILRDQKRVTSRDASERQSSPHIYHCAAPRRRRLAGDHIIMQMRAMRRTDVTPKIEHGVACTRWPNALQQQQQQQHKRVSQVFAYVARPPNVFQTSARARARVCAFQQTHRSYSACVRVCAPRLLFTIARRANSS